MVKGRGESETKGWLENSARQVPSLDFRKIRRFFAVLDGLGLGAGIEMHPGRARSDCRCDQGRHGQAADGHYNLFST